MLKRLLSLYGRFAALNYSAWGLPGKILDASGSFKGYVDTATVRRSELVVEGWSEAARIRLVLGEDEVSTVPSLLRSDVAAAYPVAPNLGFRIRIPCPPAELLRSGPPILYFDMPQDAEPLRPFAVRFPLNRLQRAGMPVRFLIRLAMATPAILGWYRRRDPAQRARVKRLLALDTMPDARPLLPGLFAPAPDGPPPDPAGRITIVLPVYNAFELVQKALARIERHTDIPWRLIAIEDASSDPRVRPFLQKWIAARSDASAAPADGAAPHCGLHLVLHDENAGFIGSVNEGLALAMRHTGPDEGPVVLLNSDALVPRGWARRLVHPMLGEDGVASVTPMSNDAEIFSTPVICLRTPLRQGQGDAIDATARRFFPGAPVAEAPTGVGFCMAMSRHWLAQVPALDSAFGRGYGEEVDWCQKVRARGGRHLVVPWLFVEHRGGESFGQGEKQALVLANNTIIARRYPAYDREVQDFIMNDPLLTPRVALALAWAGSRSAGQAIPVYMAHSMGGGAETYLERRILADVAQSGAAVVLRVGGGRRWRLEVHGPDGILGGETDDTGLIRQLLALLPRRHLVYSEGVGDPDPAFLPEMLLSLRQEGDRVEMLFHDFFPLSPSYTLLDSGGVYRGPAGPDLPEDPAHETVRADGSRMSLREWQAAWGRLAAASAELRVFSRNSAEQVRAVWPTLADRIRIVPHQLPVRPGRVEQPAADAPVLGVLGNIGLQKGAGVVRDLARGGQLRMVMIGRIDPSYALPSRVPVHGGYRPEEIPALARRYGVTHWLIPSIWPETFAYTIHEALATGLPVLAFDIGAQGEAVAAAQNGVPLPFVPGGDHAAAITEALASDKTLIKLAI